MTPLRTAVVLQMSAISHQPLCEQVPVTPRIAPPSGSVAASTISCEMMLARFVSVPLFVIHAKRTRLPAPSV